ncbi:MAG: hypothetical protein CSB55_04540 [Candidatus Cloacimonadota bacterium]|nr:MAG: hypothetical protein CSB55_04540 [Candidatus Cloacimonadota bacterium]
MGMGQYLYLAVALILLMSLTFSMYQLQLYNLENVMENQLRVNAVSLSEAIIEEAWTKYFDNSMTLGTFNPQNVPSGFTPKSKFGPEYGETFPNFNDLDDYHGMDENILFGADYLNVKAKVTYAQRDASNNLTETTSKTLMKKIKLEISTINGKLLHKAEYHYPYFN